MKRTLLSTALLAAMIVPGFAGTDTEPVGHHDAKDMKDSKDLKSVATEQSDAGFYVAALGGAQFDTDYGDKHQTLSAGGANAVSHDDINSGWGGVGGVKFGYNFNSHPVGNFMGLRLQPAVEAEALYIGDNSTTPNVLSAAFGPGATGRFSSNSGDFFLNGILRFKNNSIVTPYIGLGAGLQYITTHGSIDFPGGSITGLNTSDLDFAAQALFGLDVQICNHISLFSEYKFIDALGTDGKSSGFPGPGPGATYRFKPDQIQQNLITAGVKYSF